MHVPVNLMYRCLHVQSLVENLYFSSSGWGANANEIFYKKRAGNMCLQRSSPTLKKTYVPRYIKHSVSPSCNCVSKQTLIAWRLKGL
jgi:hypothetical protein